MGVGSGGEGGGDGGEGGGGGGSEGGAEGAAAGPDTPSAPTHFITQRAMRVLASATPHANSHRLSISDL